MKIIDFHCDTISQIYDYKQNGENINLKENKLHLDMEKMKKAIICCKFLHHMLDLDIIKIHVETCLSHIDLLYKEIEKNKDDIGIVYTYDDIIKNKKNNKMSALLSIEEGGVCKGRFSFA